MTFKFTSLISQDGKYRFIRPLIPVVLAGPKGSFEIDALLDTGADRSLFSKDLGDALGLDFSKAKAEPFGGIGKGTVKVYTLQVEVAIFGIAKHVTIPIGFVEGNNVPSLLGQEGFFDAFKITFDRNNNMIEIV